MTSRKIILLDVDDVILMDARSLELIESPIDVRPVNPYGGTDGAEEPSWVDESALAALRALPAEIEIMWVTSWLAVHYSNIDRLTELLDLRRVSVPDLNGVEPNRFGMDRSAADLGHWKTEMMRNIVRENPETPVLWVDDQLSFGLVRHLSNPLLSILAPAPGRGLTPESVQRIARWCADSQPFMKLGDFDEIRLPLPY